MVLIEWRTKDKWNGKQQKVKRKVIDPTGTLNIGQAIHVKFGRKRHDAVAAESWKDNASKDNIAAVKYFCIKKTRTCFKGVHIIEIVFSR